MVEQLTLLSARMEHGLRSGAISRRSGTQLQVKSYFLYMVVKGWCPLWLSVLMGNAWLLRVITARLRLGMLAYRESGLPCLHIVAEQWPLISVLTEQSSATVGHPHMARVWDVATGRELLALDHGTSGITDVAFSPDGMRLATAGDHVAKTWDVATGRELLTFASHTDAVTKVSFSPDGRQLTTASFDGKVMIWNASTGAALLTLPVEAGQVNWFSFSPDGKRIGNCQHKLMTLRTARCKSGIPTRKFNQ